ncbi:hypothetical protein TSAR_014003 [Trichomalopsis sarcophagae]|uniref:Uncharacterized protein n=1 Tax=Trichomalopsis sarcophagae TaxID=543379 RepID=A0A232F775_9HYME|nr:hypothetical protein TSAR_014003 [Trichomalopsis sarcophagae]
MEFKIPDERSTEAARDVNKRTEGQADLSLAEFVEKDQVSHSQATMEEQEEKSPTVATQTESTAVCHQGTSVNEFLLATGDAILTTELRIRVKCHTAFCTSGQVATFQLH